MVAQAEMPAAPRLPGGAAIGPRGLVRSWLRRRDDGRDIPAVAGPVLAPGERQLTAEVEAQGVPVVATDRAVYHRDRGGGWLRLGWDQVGRVHWDHQQRMLLLTVLTQTCRGAACCTCAPAARWRHWPANARPGAPCWPQRGCRPLGARIESSRVSGLSSCVRPEGAGLGGRAGDGQ